jgi:hypothetical protein
MWSTYRVAIEKEIENLRLARERAPCPIFLRKREIGAIRPYAFKDTHKFYLMKKATQLEEIIRRRKYQLLGQDVNLAGHFVTEEGQNDKNLMKWDKLHIEVFERTM